MWKYFSLKEKSKISAGEFLLPTNLSRHTMQNHNLLCYFVMHSRSSQCLLNRHLGWRSNIPQLVAWQTFCVLEASDVLSNSLVPYCRSCVFTLSKKLLWGQMPEQLSYWLDSCHGNQGAWQLMFHPQINYGMLLIEENAYFFLVFLSSPLNYFLVHMRHCRTFFLYCDLTHTQNGSPFSMSL